MPEADVPRDGMGAADGEGPRDPGKRATLKKLAALGALALLDGAALSSCGRRALRRASGERKVIIVGLDGLDARYVRRLMSEGKLPNMSRLRESGGFSSLASSVPPQSPVAWATFITGQDPGGHGIYDFVQRDPETYFPYLSIARTEQASRTMSLGKWRLPLSQGKVELMRRGEAFWDVLEQQGIPCAIYRAPSNFPPRDTGAKQLAGLGAPDLRGTYGEYSYFTDDPSAEVGLAAGGASYRVSVKSGRVTARIIGPSNTLREGGPESSVEFTVWVDRENRVAKVVVQGGEALLKEGEWSEWLPLSFSMVPHLKSVAGICRFYLQQVRPHFKLYVTPVNVDPMDPALPITAPTGFARELAERYGLFYTQGFPEDVKALRHGVLDEGEYLHQSEMAMGEARKMYEASLNDFQRGLLFHYFSQADRTQHMFWRLIDERHPAYDARLAREYGDAIRRCYLEADGLVGQALEAADGDTRVVALSDHGFAPFRRQFNLNRWLAEHGYLAIQEAGEGEASIFEHGIWADTAAYGMGFNGLYVNVEGREGGGKVPPSDRVRVARAIADELRRARDPDSGERVIDNVYLSDDVYRSRIPERAPDLIVGYAQGYRCADDSVLGTVSGEVVADNTDKWSGDHCVDQAAVPGVLFANREVRAEGPGLPDVTASVLAEFGVKQTKEMTGDPVW